MAHWHAVKHLLRYLNGTADYSITYAPDSSSSELFSTYSDADQGGCKDTGHSTGGYLVKIGTGAVSWSSKLQSIVALSTTEAEYIAAVSAGKEIIHTGSCLRLPRTGPKLFGPVYLLKYLIWSCTALPLVH